VLPVLHIIEETSLDTDSHAQFGYRFEDGKLI
jgi:hypothetical protein